jgi:hypothetical protein
VNGIKKVDNSDDSKVYDTFEPSLLNEKPISPSDFDAVRNSGGNLQGNSFQKYQNMSGRNRGIKSPNPPSNSKNENTT